MKTVGEIFRLSCEWLREKNPSSSRRDVESLIGSTLGLGRLDLYLNFDKPLDEDELAMIREGLGRLAKGEPIQYIEGKTQFCGCTIYLSKSVLIPRQETELLTHDIIQSLKGQTGKTFVDMCCGSGCIGIAVKKAIPELRVLLSDISPDALRMATHNAHQNGVEVECFEGDLFEALPEGTFDYVACNPPYISAVDFEALDPSVKKYEPKGALVAGQTGLEFYERIAKARARIGSTLWLELGIGQAAAVEAIFRAAGFSKIAIKQDFAGIERFCEISG